MASRLIGERRGETGMLGIVQWLGAGCFGGEEEGMGVDVG